MNGLDGWTCSIFRYVGGVRRFASELVLDAERWLIGRTCGRDGMITYVNPKKIRSQNPGCCFKKAGWKRSGVSADGRKPYLTKPHDRAGIAP